MHMINKRLLMAGTVSLVLLSGCNADRQANSTGLAAKDAVEATVNGFAISKSRVDLLAKQNINTDRTGDSETRDNVIEQLIMQTLLAEEASKKGLDKKAENKEKIDLIRQSVLADAYVQDFLQNNPVNDDTLKAEYERFKSSAGNEYKARHILVEKEAEAREIIAKLRKDPASFGKLAQEKSKDIASKAKGGDLGWFNPRRMVPEFGAAVKTLDKGKFTEEPVVTSFGYHVILLDDSRPIEAPPLDKIKTGLTQQIQQQALMKHLDEVKAKAKIVKTGASAVEAKTAPVKASTVDAK
ncbi:peptidyl-prolyl cis-trans isomerase C [Formivibrio citricus]|uniref:peptidylprolyl isomerase n=1 Tax=Formivibrio citricus TaxID=83765 RepID=A0A1I5AUN7_9NEIS|nr:peptidylprolyl isomerase [Formivibrio citricus]SFN66145.1 peptidyl-prolyl cis-trans isomerase C [Formivibrio citricus]